MASFVTSAGAVTSGAVVSSTVTVKVSVPVLPALSVAEHVPTQPSTRPCFPGWQGGPLQHVIAGKAVAFHEAMQPSFTEYAKQIVVNATRVGGRSGERRVPLVSGGTDSHLMVVDLRPFDAELSGKETQAVLDQAGITLNKNTIPDDPRSPFVTSGVPSAHLP